MFRSHHQQCVHCGSVEGFARRTARQRGVMAEPSLEEDLPVDLGRGGDGGIPERREESACGAYRYVCYARGIILPLGDTAPEDGGISERRGLKSRRLDPGSREGRGARGEGAPWGTSGVGPSAQSDGYEYSGVEPCPMSRSGT